jgi:hypothetical protein
MLARENAVNGSRKGRKRSFVQKRWQILQGVNVPEARPCMRASGPFILDRTLSNCPAPFLAERRIARGGLRNRRRRHAEVLP